MPERFQAEWLVAAALLLAIFYAVVLLPFTCFQRSKAVAAAGTLQLRVVRPRVRRQQRALSILWVCVGVGFLGSLILGNEQRDLLLLGCCLLVGTISEVANRVFGLDPLAVEIREKGLVVNSAAFYPWDQIRAYRWEDGKIPTLVLQLRGYGFSRYGIASEQKGAIEELLQHQLQTVANSQQPQGAAPPNQPGGRRPHPL